LSRPWFNGVASYALNAHVQINRAVRKRRKAPPVGDAPLARRVGTLARAALPDWRAPVIVEGNVSMLRVSGEAGGNENVARTDEAKFVVVLPFDRSM
jgi:hypothetical protein